MALSGAVAACDRRAAPVATSASGTTGTPPHTTVRAFTDEAGRPVLPRVVPARRLVSLAPNVTELLFAIGAGAQVVGRDNYSDAPAGMVERIPKLGTNYQPSLEKILALSPDVVFTSISANRRETVESLERLGIPVFVTDTRGIADIDRTYVNLGALTGRTVDAEQQIARLRTGFDSIRLRIAGKPRPRVLVVVWDDPLYVAGRGTFTHDLIELAGGSNVASDAVGFAKYPLERVLHAAPDVLVIPTHAQAGERTRATKYWSRWPQLPAVRTNRVHAVDDAVISRPGARLVEGAELLARLFHSDATAN